MSRYYRIEEAEAALNDVEAALRRGIHLKSEMETADLEFSRIKQRIHMLGGSTVNRSEMLALRQRRDSAASGLKSTLDQIEAYGCLIKDLDIGLIDFPTLYRGEEVYLCWRLGEPAILFWHGITDGFQGRKIIDEEFRNNHKGSAPQ